MILDSNDTHATARLTVHKTGPGTADYHDIMAIRTSRSSVHQAGDPSDASADHYLAVVDGRPLACMRVQQARRGRLDCEDHYPAAFVARFRGVIGSASRLVRRADAKACPDVMRRFVAAVWRDQYRDGIRVDLINVHVPMVPYYETMGYELVAGSAFVHPRLQTSSMVMAMLAEPSVRSSLRTAFEGGHDPELMLALRGNLFGNGVSAQRESA